VSLQQTSTVRSATKNIVGPTLKSSVKSNQLHIFKVFFLDRLYLNLKYKYHYFKTA